MKPCGCKKKIYCQQLEMNKIQLLINHVSHGDELLIILCS